jgi:N-acetylglucosamine kinase-like BadF-type ATPase
MRYFLGVDVGATKTHALIADETGQAVGFGQSGPGNHESMGYDGLALAMSQATASALAMASLTAPDLAGAGFGIAGYDWPAERADTLAAIGTLGLEASIGAVNDTLIGLLAGSEAGWGVAVVSGTGCNCWGWDRDRRRVGQMTGGGEMMGEAAGATEVMARAIRAVAHDWSGRGPRTQLSSALIRLTGARDLPDLLHGLTEGRLRVMAQAAPLVFEVAAAGDEVAREVIEWAGRELGEMALTVARQLGFQTLDFDLVMVGSLFNGGPLLIDPMRATVLAGAPGARLVRLSTPPVVGAVLLGMEQAGLEPTARRANLARSTQALLQPLAQPAPTAAS